MPDHPTPPVRPGEADYAEARRLLESATSPVAYAAAYLAAVIAKLNAGQPMQPVWVAIAEMYEDALGRMPDPGLNQRPYF